MKAGFTKEYFSKAITYWKDGKNDKKDDENEIDKIGKVLVNETNVDLDYII